MGVRQINKTVYKHYITLTLWLKCEEDYIGWLVEMGRELPGDWTKAAISLIISVYKGTGGKSIYGNYQGISLWSKPGKIYTKAIVISKERVVVHERIFTSIHEWDDNGRIVDRELLDYVVVSRNVKLNDWLIGDNRAWCHNIKVIWHHNKSTKK